MPDRERPATTSQDQNASASSDELRGFEAGSKGESLRQMASKPVVIVAAVMAVLILGLVLYLQQDPEALRLAAPEARYELLPNLGRTEGIPIAIYLGPVTVFQISDPAAGGGGAIRARQVVDNLAAAVQQLMDSPGRVITIGSGGAEGMPTIVQKEKEDTPDSLEIVQVTADDLTLAMGDDPKLLARVWAERLTDTLRLLIFGQPPEFSRDTAFGGALDTLYVNVLNEDGRLTTEGLSTAFEALSDELRSDLISFPALPEPSDAQPNS